MRGTELICRGLHFAARDRKATIRHGEEYLWKQWPILGLDYPKNPRTTSTTNTFLSRHVNDISKAGIGCAPQKHPCERWLVELRRLFGLISGAQAQVQAQRLLQEYKTAQTQAMQASAKARLIDSPNAIFQNISLLERKPFEPKSPQLLKRKTPD